MGVCIPGGSQLFYTITGYITVAAGVIGVLASVYLGMIYYHTLKLFPGNSLGQSFLRVVLSGGMGVAMMCVAIGTTVVIVELMLLAPYRSVALGVLTLMGDLAIVVLSMYGFCRGNMVTRALRRKRE